EHFGADLVMRPSEIIADECVAQLTSPLLLRFLRHVRRQTDGWADDVIHRLRNASGKRSPATWEVRIDREQAPAVCRHGVDAAGIHAADAGPPALRLGDLLRDPHDRNGRVEATVLLALRDGRETLLPDDDWTLAEGDELLFAGKETARRFVRIGLHDRGVLDYLVTGREPGRQWPWQRSGRTT